MLRRQFLHSAATLAAIPLVGACGITTAVPPAPENASADKVAPERVQFHNIAALAPTASGDAWRLCRYPLAVAAQLTEPGHSDAFMPAGGEIRFRLLAGEARVRLRRTNVRRTVNRRLTFIAETYFGDYSAGWTEIGEVWTEILVKPHPAAGELARAHREQPGRFAPDLVRIVLPLLDEIHVGAIAGDIAPPAPAQAPRRRYLAYGSSITHGVLATRPSDTYPARVARRLGVDCLNLGLSGGAKLEPAVADAIAARADWDFASLELGINLLSSRSPEEFRALVRDFLPRIVARHRDKWIFCVDLFRCVNDLRDDPKIVEFRAIVRDAVRELQAPRLVHLDGLQLLERWSGLTNDLLHPTTDGFIEIADKLAAAMRPVVPTG